jgi:hypothetical protein
LIQQGRPRILIAALLVALAMAYAPVARSGGVVSSCDEASLLTAVTGGGIVTFTCSGTITLTAGITISADTTIDGTGQNITISGGNAVQVLFVSRAVQLNLNKITIANGSSLFGGGILNQGTLTVTNSTFSGNYSAGYGGGCILNANGALLTVTNSMFSGNSSAEDAGGGIFNGGTLTVTNSTFSGNSGAFGGGISTIGALTVTNSTFSDNSAQIYGGGIENNFGTLTVTNSTFSDNRGAFRGGSIANFGPLTLRNTIVANSPSGGNCANFVSLTDDGGNLDTDGTCVGTMSPDPLLGPLQNNGGPTQTLAIPMASPAFGGANVANCPATDQRGLIRPQFLFCDIGAYEFGTANSLLAAVRNEISALIPTGNNRDQRILSTAASDLSAALNSLNWQGTDGNHLNPSRAEEVFEVVKEGVCARLTHLQNASPPSAIPAQTLQTLLNNLTLAGRTLAAVAITDAAGGNAIKLARANALLAKGDTDAAARKYVSALVDYEFAWALVQRDE